MSLGPYSRLHATWHNKEEVQDTDLDKVVFTHFEDAHAAAFDAITALQNEVGAASGLATLGSDGILTSAQRPPSGGGGGTPLMSPLGFLMGGS